MGEEGCEPKQGQGQGGGDGQRPRVAPARFPPVCVWVGWAGKAAARHVAHPRRCLRHKRGRGRRVKRRTIVAIEGVAGAGASHRALCGGVNPFRAGPRKTRSPMDPPGKGSVPHRRTTRARAPNTPRISALEERATLVVGRRGWPSPHNHHHIAPIPLDIIYMTLEIGSGQAGARDNVGGAYGGPSTGRRTRRKWRRFCMTNPFVVR